MSIKLEHLNYVYSQGTAYEKQALKDICLEIPDGEFVGIVGHTGSGKSTLIQHFNGLIKATSGALYYNGENIYSEGYTINGNSQARIFSVTNYVNFNNINFINAYSDTGSAILGSNFAVSNCNFTNNYATTHGGAISGGYASNCIFTSNTADNRGGAIYKGSADSCIFRENVANEGGAIYDVYATKSTFIDNLAHKQGGAMQGSSAGQCTFIGNSAEGFSGAAFNAYVVDCTFINNTATHAGAIGGGSNSASNCLP